MICSNCQKFNDDDNLYCTNCNTVLKPHEVPTLPMPDYNTQRIEPYRYLVFRFEVPEYDPQIFTLELPKDKDVFAFVTESKKERERCPTLFVKTLAGNSETTKVQFRIVHQGNNLVQSNWKYIGSWVDKRTGEARHLFEEGEVSQL